MEKPGLIALHEKQSMEHTDVLCMFQQHVLMLSRCCTDMYVVTVPNRAVQFIRDDRGCRADLEVCVCVT